MQVSNGYFGLLWIRYQALWRVAEQNNNNYVCMPAKTPFRAAELGSPLEGGKIIHRFSAVSHSAALTGCFGRLRLPVENNGGIGG